jgi:hypothetical protein
MVKEPGTPCRPVFSFDFWFVVAVVLSLGGHTDTYRTVVYDDGAFELCLPSLGFCYQITTLRTTILGRTLFMIGLGSGGPVRPPCLPRQRHVGLQHYEVLSVGLSIGAGHLRLRLGLLLECVLEVSGVCERAHDQDPEYYA